ncbi:hypothetical protein KC799_19945 [candidate division KSB1 bacterium]|nr:hypothetical protein [candidate division KSB1 bacterium]
MQKHAPLLFFTLFLSTTAISAMNWQQDVRYNIETQVDTTAKKLLSYMELIYKNNSPDTLDRIYLQVPANAFQDEDNTAVREMAAFNRGNIQFDQRARDALTINSVQFLSIGEENKFPLQAFHFTDTILDLRLPSPLLPNDSLKVGVSFEQDLSRALKRKDESRILISRNSWLPLIAVYDSSGWRAEPFHFMMQSSDVFTEFATFDVTITAPWNYTIVTSGDSVSGDAGWSLFQGDTTMVDSVFTAWLDTLQKDYKLQGEKEGLRVAFFIAKKSHNFTWVASPSLVHYQYQTHGKTIDLFDRNKKSRQWIKSMTEVLDSTLLFYENYFGEYPIDRFSMINFFGMSQPKFIYSSSDRFELAATFVEAILPGRVSVNTIEEGWISKGLSLYVGKKFNEQKWGKRGYDLEEAQEDQNWIERRYPLPSLDQLMKDFTRLYMSSGQNEAISKPIHKYSDPISYFMNSYVKADQFYEMLEYVIGDSALRECTRELVRQHTFQHISEKQWQEVCEQASGQELDWFFEQWLHGTPTVDYKKGKVKKYQREDKKWVTEVEIERKGDGIMPVDVDLDIGDGQKITQRFDGFAQRGTIVFVTDDKPKQVKVDPKDAILDNNMLNNGKPKLEFKPDLPLLKMYYMPGDTYLVLWRPLFGYNLQDGFKLGLRTAGSYRSVFNNLVLEAEYGFLSQSVDGKIGYSHPIRRSDMMHRYGFMARRKEGRYELDAKLDFNFAEGIISKKGRQLKLGFNLIGVNDLDYLYRKITNNQDSFKITEWQDTDIFSFYIWGKFNNMWHYFSSTGTLNFTSAMKPGDATFTKLHGRVEGRYTRFGISGFMNINGGLAAGKDALPLQEKYDIANASPIDRFRNDMISTGGDWENFGRRFTEGGARLFGYAGRPTPLEKYASYNLELGLDRAIFGTRWFGFYDEGWLWNERKGNSLRRSDAGIGFRLFDSKSLLFGGNVPLFEGLSIRTYFPFWVSHPLPGEEKNAFRWFMAIGKKF